MRTFLMSGILLLCCLAFAPTAQAIPGDCEDTCNPGEACGVLQCMQCIVPYDEDNCAEWGLTTCEVAGICGGCVFVSSWYEDTYSAWQAILTPQGVLCDGASRYRLFQRTKFRTHYEERYCNGQVTIVAVGQDTTVEECGDWIMPAPCFGFDSTGATPHICPFDIY